MAHMIDTTAGNAIAYRGQTPWHGLGQTIDATDDIDTIVTKARLNYTVEDAPVLFTPHARLTDPGLGILRSTKTVPGRKVLYRSDTLQPLSVVSRDYNVVQPAEVLEFFRELVRVGGFSIETAGALSGGRRVWALARLGEGANIIGQDRVRPFLLLATSYDGTMATMAKYVNERVVCHNTITMALGEDSHQVKVYHSQKFDPAAVRHDMGIALNSFETWLLRARRLAERPVSEQEAGTLTIDLLRPTVTLDDVTKSRGYQQIMALFDGQAIGSGLTEGGTAWQWLNAATEYVDHVRGRTADTRMNSAWFGDGDRLKTRAESLAAALVS